MSEMNSQLLTIKLWHLPLSVWIPFFNLNEHVIREKMEATGMYDQIDWHHVNVVRTLGRNNINVLDFFKGIITIKVSRIVSMHQNIYLLQ